MWWPMRTNRNPVLSKTAKFLNSNPYQFLEGLMLAAYAVQANDAYIYLRGEFWQIAQQLDDCIESLERPACWAIIYLAASIPCGCIPIWVPGRTSAVKRPRCWNRSKANSDNRACARLSRRLMACSASRPSSIMWKLSPIFRPSLDHGADWYKTTGYRKISRRENLQPVRLHQ